MQTFRTTQHLEQEKRKLFSSSSRILIKVGTAVLTNDDGSFDAKTFQHLCYQLAELKRAGKEIVLVTSGAIGFGKVLFNLEEPLTVSSQQSSAAAGQILLMGRYLEEFSKYDIKIAQLLLTRENFSDRKSLANLWGCISKLFYLGAIPIINENDVISSDELQHSTTFGDNDVLASMAAKSLIVGSILFLSDVDGLLDANGNLISYVEGATSFSEVLDNGNGRGKGGIKSKLSAIENALDANILSILANGKKENIMLDAFSPKRVGTLFVP